MRKLVVTTSWDDGHVLDLRVAELLRKYGLTGTFYVSPKCREIKSRNRLSELQIRSLSRNFEVGAHTMTHPRLPKTTLTEAGKEIRHSKEYLERIIGKKIQSFCYPGGAYNKKHLTIVKDAGFSYARTVKRLSTKPAKNNLVAPTTIHAYKHYQDITRILILSKFHPTKFWKLFSNWDELAIFLFDKAKQSGGVFHLWGHSWEIDGHSDWKRLEKVLAHIGKRSDVTYITNRELAQ